jgi:hypothetical protein
MSEVDIKLLSEVKVNWLNNNVGTAIDIRKTKIA